ncbi:N-acetylmuramoyl-L-alanine amidase [Pseudenhygromyxa sp. WMMC2535]|uniref:N-acetylmuramoyl-L-alanine amidase family protein n=1 Tax=Pseudenhygromyxa sp. WMMC2535 TaxID=2712867 RepID=UPI001553B3DD|nr:N-acetylmuramoyl-L-alanine amidase [Pseudenhygromyxa sp. WMMC2535]NVB42391.1 N-acetylmuramoyl-L-alanine amidase [Pseudenhygromyxa sp. WMMC2535]
MKRRAFLLAAASTAGTALLAPRRSWAAPRPVTEQRFRVVIDPGHGGENAGCHAHDGSVDEKALTLVMAQRLAERLVAIMPHAEVLLTRERDETLHLNQRVAFANDCGADLFLSLHCNASPHSDQTGFETFVLDADASSKEAALTAQRENDEGFSRPVGGEDDEVAQMLRELGMSGNRQQALRFAKAIQDEQVRRFPERPNRGVRQAAFDVLKGARMPAVLHEVGFLDHADEGELLRSEAGQARIVEGLAQATLRYFNEVARRA